MTNTTTTRCCDWCKLLLPWDPDPVVIGRGHVHRGHCADAARDWLRHARATVDFWGDADASIARGLAQQGTIDRGSFTQYVRDVVPCTCGTGYDPECQSDHGQATPAQYVPSSWVPCSERLPPVGDRVLMTVTGTDTLYDGIAEVGVYYADGWDCDDEDAAPYDPTHWMPLPAPPKEVTT